MIPMRKNRLIIILALLVVVGLATWFLIGSSVFKQPLSQLVRVGGRVIGISYEQGSFLINLGTDGQLQLLTTDETTFAFPGQARQGRAALEILDIQDKVSVKARGDLKAGRAQAVLVEVIPAVGNEAPLQVFNITGQIAAIDEQTIIVESNDLGQQASPAAFQISDKTVLKNKDGSPAAFSDIKPGIRVLVTTDENVVGKDFVEASSIRLLE